MTIKETKFPLVQALEDEHNRRFRKIRDAAYSVVLQFDACWITSPNAVLEAIQHLKDCIDIVNLDTDI